MRKDIICVFYNSMTSIMLIHVKKKDDIEWAGATIASNRHAYCNIEYLIRDPFAYVFRTLFELTFG